MTSALEQAREAHGRGEFPVGCVVVQDRRIVATGKRHGTSPSAASFGEMEHAEINCIKNLEENGALKNPDPAVLFCTMEPCLMCYGAIIISGIRDIVYAYEDPMGGGTGCDLTSLPPLYSTCRMKITPGILRGESLRLFYDFFTSGRNEYWKNSLLADYTIRQMEGLAY
ncbi:MAG: nucleoside deaminase [Desulfarculaceae bacterium]|nr:nucleoside deaminase [Desulfarculaceae bacterium]